MAVDDPKFSIEVFRQNSTSEEKQNGVSSIDILNKEVIYDENGDARCVVEIFRSEPMPIETNNSVRLIEKIMPGGTLSNIGVGPIPPDTPYEGQVWILT